MNKLLTPNGGMPLYLDDAAFLDGEMRDGFKAILHEIAAATNGNLILGGCVLTETPTTATLSEGYVMLAYEVYYVSGNTVSKTGSYSGEILPDIYASAAPAATRSFANGSSQNVWQVRRAKLGPNLVVSDAYINMPGGARLSKAIANALKPQYEILNISGLINGWNNDPVVPLRAYRQLGMVHLQGTIGNGTMGVTSWVNAFVLPAGWRPAQDVYTVTTMSDSSGNIEVAHVFIEAVTGAVALRKTATSFSQNAVSFGVGFQVP